MKTPGHGYYANSGKPLTEKERDTLGRMLADPMSFPQDFRQWLENYINGQTPYVPPVNIPGSGVVQIGDPAASSLTALMRTLGVTAYYKFKESSYESAAGTYADAVEDDADWTQANANLSLTNDATGGTNVFVPLEATSNTRLILDEGACDFLTIPTAVTVAGDYEGACFNVPSMTVAQRAKFAYTSNKITYTCWCAPKDVAVATYEAQLMGTWAEYGGSFRGFGLIYDADSNSLVAKVHPTGGSLVEISKVITPTSWYHCAITLDSGTMRFYVDGALVGAATYSASGIGTVVSYLNWRVGKGLFDVGIGDYDGYYYGALNEVGVFAGTALTQAQIQSIVTTSIADPETGLFASVGGEHQVMRTDSSGAASWGLPTRQTVTVTAAYTATTADDVILVDASGGAKTITLPAAASSEGLNLEIKKADSTAYVVTIDGNGSETIDGQLTVQIDQPYTSLTLVCNGTAWYII